MDVLICIFFLCFLYKIQIKKNEEEYLSLEYTKYLKGILALIVVFCHIQYDRINLPIFKVFNYVGDFAVALFFFLSGYGLMSQYIKKRQEYLKDFLSKRILKLIIIYVVFIVIYTLTYFANGTFKTVNDLLKVIFSKKLIVAHSWYIIDILILYLIFWISAKLFKNNYKKIILSILILSILGIILFIGLGYSECWYVSILSFVLGMIYKECQEEIEKIDNKTIYLCFGIGLLVFLGLQFMIGKIPNILIQKYIMSFIKNFACICFVIIVVNIGKKVQFKNPIYEFVGKISLELYLIHGLYENIFKNITIISNSNLIYGILVLGISVFTAYLIHKLNMLINQKLTNKSRYLLERK